MSWPAPRIWLNGRRLDTTAAGRVLILTPLTISWGSSTGEEQPDPANAKLTFLFLDSMSDLPDLAKGAEIEVTDPGSESIVLAGTVTTMSAKPSTRFRGALEVVVNIVDYLAPFDSEYTQVNWGEGTNRVNQLHNEFNAAGWELRIPEDGRTSAATRVNSIKLGTLLERHISRYRGRRYDTSYRSEEDLVLHKRISVYKGSARALTPDLLLASSSGWGREFITPMIEGVPAPAVILEANNILNDPSWTSGPEDAVTAVSMSTVTMGDNGFSELEEHNYRAPAPTVKKLGLRSISIESDLADVAEWPPAAAQYFNDDAPWRMDALTIRDTDLLRAETMNVLLSPHSRYQALAIITGIAENRPDPGPSDLRSFLVGGEFTWTGKRWDISLTLERTIQHLDGEGDWWTCARVAQSTNPLICQATCQSVGNELTVADFRFIGAP